MVAMTQEPGPTRPISGREGGCELARTSPFAIYARRPFGPPMGSVSV